MSVLASINIGAKVTIRKPQLGVGTVRFVGTTQFAEGTWVGIELEKPGKLN